MQKYKWQDQPAKNNLFLLVSPLRTWNRQISFCKLKLILGHKKLNWSLSHEDLFFSNCTVHAAKRINLLTPYNPAVVF